jgi:hypothetical protein
MHIPSTIPTSFGPSVVAVRATVSVTLTPHDLFAVTRQIERDADEAGAAGDDVLAARLDWCAADLREAAR